MAKKPRSEKQLANDERLRNRKKKEPIIKPLTVEELEAQKAEQATPPETPTPVAGLTAEQKDALLLQLLSKVTEMENKSAIPRSVDESLEQTAKMQGYNVNVGKDGVQGRVFKYPVEKSFYPDPTERLYDEPILKRFNLRENFYFDWEVEGVEYEKYGVTYAEPRFIVRLFRRLFEDDGITPSGQLALVNRQIQHEDEVAARTAASKLGMTDQFESFQEMMDEMRYYRIRQWLLDLFTPVQVHSHTKQATTMVIDGKVVEVYDTEAIIDGDSGKSKASTIKSQVRI